MRAHLREELEAADAELLERLLQGSRRHARRRGEEMRAAASLLDDLGVPPHIALASAAVLDDLLADSKAASTGSGWRR